MMLRVVGEVDLVIVGCWDRYSPQEPRSRWKYLALAHWQSHIPTATPAIVMMAGRYPLATWMIGIAGHPPEIAQPGRTSLHRG